MPNLHAIPWQLCEVKTVDIFDSDEQTNEQTDRIATKVYIVYK